MKVLQTISLVFLVILALPTRSYPAASSVLNFEIWDFILTSEFVNSVCKKPIPLKFKKVQKESSRIYLWEYDSAKKTSREYYQILIEVDKSGKWIDPKKYQAS